MLIICPKGYKKKCYYRKYFIAQGNWVGNTNKLEIIGHLRQNMVKFQNIGI